MNLTDLRLKAWDLENTVTTVDVFHFLLVSARISEVHIVNVSNCTLFADSDISFDVSRNCVQEGHFDKEARL